MINFLNLEFTTFQEIIFLAIPLAGLILCLYPYRKKYTDGYISYGRALGMGVVITIIFGVCATFYNYIYTSLINPDFFQEAQIIMEEKLLNKQISPGDIEMVLKKTAWTKKPFNYAILNLTGFIFRGTIFSLIISTFVKKENKNPFKNVI